MEHEHPHKTSTQPEAKPSMSTSMSAEMTHMAKDAGKDYAKGMAKEAGKQTMDYEKQNGQQQYEQAKAEAEGLWAKYCGCFSG